MDKIIKMTVSIDYKSLEGNFGKKFGKVGARPLSDINFINQVVKSSNNKVFKTKIDDIDMDGIFISTIHSTKGAEFDTVLVDVDSFKRTSLKFLEKDARYTLTEEDFESLDEELKILYVAVTRAKKSLLLFDSRRLIA